MALWNLANARYYRIVVLTQYKSHSLDVHLAKTWRMAPVLGNHEPSLDFDSVDGSRYGPGSVGRCRPGK